MEEEDKEEEEHLGLKLSGGEAKAISNTLATVFSYWVSIGLSDRWVLVVHRTNGEEERKILSILVTDPT